MLAKPSETFFDAPHPPHDLWGMGAVLFCETGHWQIFEYSSNGGKKEFIAINCETNERHEMDLASWGRFTAADMRRMIDLGFPTRDKISARPRAGLSPLEIEVLWLRRQVYEQSGEDLADDGPDEDVKAKFTVKELEAIRLLALPIKVSSHRIKITPSALKLRIRSILGKIDAESRIAAAVMLAREGFEIETAIGGSR